MPGILGAACAGSAPSTGAVDAQADPADAPVSTADGGPGADAGRAGADAGIDGGPSASGPFAVPFPATATCAPTGDVCAAPAHDVAAASYRKDFFYPYADYPEASLPDPVDGGRVHVVLTASSSGPVTGLRIAGQSAEALRASGWLDWIHVWPEHATAGAPLWVSLHAARSELDGGASLAVAVEGAAGDLAVAEVSLAPSPVRLTYVTARAARDRYFVHVRNTGTSPQTLSRLVVDGLDVTDAACIPSPVLAPGEAALWTVPLCQPTRTGALWSVVAEWQGAPPSVAGGRVIPAHFPVHTWPVGDDCPFPGGKADNFAAHVTAGFDTFFMRGSYGAAGCNGIDAHAIVASAQASDFFVMPDEFWDVPEGWGEAEHIPVQLLADEADTDPDTGATTRRLSAIAQETWASNPTMATYVGGSRHRRVGTFAGVADIQGMDFYVAACAPHVTDFFAHPPLRGAYDYLRATRENHMPLPTWTYTQGLHAGWNADILGLEIVRQPDPTEARIQAFSVVAAGAKGLMYFQSDMALAGGAAAATWQAITEQNREIGAVRRLLREGDPTGEVGASSPDVIVEAIRAPDALVLVAIDVASSGGIDDLACQISLEAPHWQVEAVSADLTVRIPPDLPVADVFEIRGGAIVDAPAGMTYDGRTVTIPAVAMDAAQPTRMIVFARTAGVRAEVAAAL